MCLKKPKTRLLELKMPLYLIFLSKLIDPFSLVNYIRELLDYGVLDAFAWTDTRDMLADGMTKGAIDRKDLHEVMAGNICILHDTIRLWRPSTRQVLEQ